MNSFYVDRYFKFIDRCNTRVLNGNSYTEVHHIIPVSMGGDSNFENLITLSGREHYIAHWILAKAYGGSMWYAFWMMNTDMRLKNRRYKNSKGYEIAKVHIKQLMSTIHSGKLTAKNLITGNCEQVTVDEYKNSHIYKHVSSGKSLYILNNKCVQLSTTDTRVLSGEAKHIRIGYKHKKSTIEKMKSSSIKGKIAITNGEKLRYIDKNSPIDTGWTIGYSKQQREKRSSNLKKVFKTCKWITDGVNNRRIDITKYDIPDGWKIGRILKTRICPYCGKTVDVANYAKHHGEKCEKRTRL